MGVLVGVLPGVPVGSGVAPGVEVDVGVGVGEGPGVDVGVGLGVGLGVGVVSSRLVNTHFTTSSAPSLNVAVRVATLPVLSSSSQSIELSSKGEGESASVDVYSPATRSLTTICPLSARLPAASPLKLKVAAAPPGMVCFSTMIVPRGASSLVTVQVFVSPAAMKPSQSAEKLFE